MTHTQRALRALLLPFTATVVIPSILVTVSGTADTRWNVHAAGYGFVFLVALTLMLVAILLFSLTVRLFADIGRGTLAPWDPPKKLVISGPYRVVRNPMISGVLGVLVAEALLLGSVYLALWAVVFVAINHTYFVLSEEPRLLRRYGDAYKTYMQQVPRWIPRISARTPQAGERKNDEPTC